MTADKDKGNNKDIFRDTPVRYLGYANEVGEAFRSHLHVNWVRSSYAVASSYVIADAVHKGNKVKQLSWPSSSVRTWKVCYAVVDTLIWQGLASVAIPGFTIYIYFKLSWPSSSIMTGKVCYAVVDTLIWQGLASVAIPGFTINRICWASARVLANFPLIKGPTRRWAVTAIGLCSIPFIIKPIDNSVDWLLESTLRKWNHIEPILETEIVHHHRDD